MPIPLLPDPTKLAQTAAAMTPRFAAVLATNQEPGAVVVNRRAATNDVLSLFPADGSVLTRWAVNSAKYAALGLAAAGAIGAVETGAGQVAEHLKSLTVRRLPALQAVYDRVLGETTSLHRLRSATEQREDLMPAQAGKSSPVVDQAADFDLRQEHEAMLLAAAIVGIGFEAAEDNAERSTVLDNTVLNNIRDALNVIAPGKLLSEISPLELHAVATTATYAASSAYLDKKQAEEPAVFHTNRLASQKLLSAAKDIPSASRLAQLFMESGAFSNEKYLAALPDPVASAAPQSIATATPSQIQGGLLRASTAKAVSALASVEPLIRGQQPTEGEAVWARKSVLAIAKSVTTRQDRLEMAHRPAAHDVPSM